MATEVILEGGFINNVQAQLDNGNPTVTKRFTGESLTGVPVGQRLRREHVALKRFSRFGIAPQPLEVHPDRGRIVMEYVPSTLYLDDHIKMTSGDEKKHILHEAGTLLHQVHQSVNHDTQAYLTRYTTKTIQSLQKTEQLSLGEGIDVLQVFHRIDTTLKSEEAKRQGITHIHRDPWLNNFLYTDKQIVGLIDWEFAGIGSPYEDFAVVDLWITREHGDTSAFWEGYGQIPERTTLLGFVLAKCVQLLGNTDIKAYTQEKQQGGGFYTNKVAIVKHILSELQERSKNETDEN